MANFGILERRAAGALNRFPAFKSFIKRLYQRLNYILVRESGFRYRVNSDFRLNDVAGEIAGETFFGYYGISPWSADQKSFAFHRFLEGETVDICLNTGGQIEIVGRTSAWNFQQGSMLQWVPTEGEKILVFNRVIDQQLVSTWHNVTTGYEYDVPFPVQSVSPDGTCFVSLNYARLSELRPDYGYKATVKNFSARMEDAEDGLWLVSSNGCSVRLVVSLEKLRCETPGAQPDCSHKVNHVVFDPSGDSFVFVYRWFGVAGKQSRLYKYDIETDQLTLLLDHEMVSHYCWRDPNTLIVYGRYEQGDRYYSIDVRKRTIVPFGPDDLVSSGDGHPSICSADGRLVTDTYPNRKRQQSLWLINSRGETATEIGRFLSPLHFDGLARVDLHPRWRSDGLVISLDSGHTGRRRVYVLEFASVG